MQDELDEVLCDTEADGDEEDHDDDDDDEDEDLEEAPCKARKRVHGVL